MSECLYLPRSLDKPETDLLCHTNSLLVSSEHVNLSLGFLFPLTPFFFLTKLMLCDQRKPHPSCLFMKRLLINYCTDVFGPPDKETQERRFSFAWLSINVVVSSLSGQVIANLLNLSEQKRHLLLKECNDDHDVLIDIIIAIVSSFHPQSFSFYRRLNRLLHHLCLRFSLWSQDLSSTSCPWIVLSQFSLSSLLKESRVILDIVILLQVLESNGKRERERERF